MRFFKKRQDKKSDRRAAPADSVDKDEFCGYVEKLLEDTDQPTDDEIDDRFTLENMSMSEKYSVDKAIALLQDLPEVDPDIIATIVRKTLESADIDVNNIIHSAQAKEDKLHSDVEKLNREIKILLEQINIKKEQINKIGFSLDEIRRAKTVLQQSFGLPDSDLKTTNKDSSQPSLTDTGRFNLKAN